MVLPTVPGSSLSVSQILTEFGIAASTISRISNDLFPLVDGTAGTTCLLGASFSNKAAGSPRAYSYLQGTGTDQGLAIAVDSAGNIYITGQYVSTTTVPILTMALPPAASGKTLPISVGTDMFVIKY